LSAKPHPPTASSWCSPRKGAKLTTSAQDLDKKSKGLLDRAVEITGFKGKKEQTVDLLAPQGLKFARIVLAG
jgi:leucyl aminopeptidase